MHAIPNDPEFFTDEQREAMISYAKARMERAFKDGDDTMARHYCKEMTQLINERSPEQIAKMESQGGVR